MRKKNGFQAAYSKKPYIVVFGFSSCRCNSMCVLYTQFVWNGKNFRCSREQTNLFWTYVWEWMNKIRTQSSFFNFWRLDLRLGGLLCTIHTLMPFMMRLLHSKRRISLRWYLCEKRDLGAAYAIASNQQAINGEKTRGGIFSRVNELCGTAVGWQRQKKRGKTETEWHK